MKKALLLSAVAISALAINAQDDYHGFCINPSQALIDNKVGTILPAGAYRIEGKAISLQAIFQTEYKPVMASEDLQTFTAGSTTKGEAGSVVDHTTPNKEGTVPAFENGDIDGIMLQSVMDDNGLAYVTVPAQYYQGGTLTDVPAEGGDIRVRICLESNSKSRLGDAENCRVDDITGVYVTVDAPTYVKITSDFIQGNTTTQFNAGQDEATNDALGKMQRCAIFELPSTTATGPQNINMEGKAKGSYNLFTYKRAKKDAWGFPLRYVDIVFYGVKPGDRIGWTNYQTLYDGYTPKAYSGSASIEAIEGNATELPEEYYNLQGMKIANPTTAGFYIVRQGSTSKKVFIRK